MPLIERLQQQLSGLTHTIAEGGAALHADLAEFIEQLKGWATKQNPEPVFAVLRRMDPILVHEGFALVTRFDDVQEVLSREAEFHVPYAQKFADLCDGGNFFLGMQNSPEYERNVSAMRLVARRDDIATAVIPIVQRTADAIVAAAPGTIEVVSQLANVVPTTLVAEYFGTPSPDGAAFAAQAATMSGYLFLPAGQNDPDVTKKAKAAAESMREVLRGHIDARKTARGKRDDVLERCLALQDSGLAGMSDASILDNLFGLVVGAIPTTGAAAARALDELLKRPDELARAQDAARMDDYATVTQFVMEAMRFNPLGPGVFRIAAEDYTVAKGTLRGRTIPQGTNVLAAIQSAGFDENRIDSPNDFRTDRPPYDYMHFGYGLHTCFGQYINVVQIPRILMPLLKQRGLRRAAGDAGTLIIDGPFPTSLHVEWDA